MPFAENLQKARKNKGLSQDDLVENLNKLAGTDFKRPTISNYENGVSQPGLDLLPVFAKILDVGVEELLGVASGKKNDPLGKNFEQVGAANVLVTTINSTGNETIVLVPVKAQAGYLVGSSHIDYIERLPNFWLPGMKHGTFRAFEVSGYSMLADRIGFFPGDIVVCQHCESVRDIKDGRIYVLVNSAADVDDIVLKRCLNYIDKGGLIICKSDNKDPQYPTFPLPAADIKEVWEFKMKLTRQAPEPSGLYERINAVEGDIEMVKEQLRKILG